MEQSPDTNDRADTDKPSKRSSRAPSARTIILVLAIGALALGYEYRAAVLSSSLIVWFPLLLCVGIHFFMHGGHGKHRRTREDDDQ